jgi:hypothetical protein
VTIQMSSYAGDFAENKDVARALRVEKIMPALAKGEIVILDFEKVTGATQSFIHALISDAIRMYGDDVFDLLQFQDCSLTVEQVINIVADYMQESL